MKFKKSVISDMKIYSQIIKKNIEYVFEIPEIERNE